MKVLLLYPPYRHSRSFLPNGMAYVARSLLDAGHEVKVLDADAFTYSKQQLEQQLIDEEYDVLGIGCLVTAYSFVIDVSDFIKKIKPSVYIMVGGSLATYSYEEVLRNSKADFCIIGEGEITAIDLFSAISGKMGFREVDGIAYREGNAIVTTKPRALIEDLDKMPFPARDLFHTEEIYSRNTIIKDVFKAGRHIFISGSRGCPYSCTFCGYETRVRLRSAKNIIEELKYLKERYKIKNFSFEDDLFMVNQRRTEEFCNGLIKEKLDLSWKTSGRVNLVTKEMLRLMKKAGCYAISYGIESGSPEVLRRMKKNTTPEQVEKAIRITHEAGIRPGGTWILGMPGETPETVRMSVDLYKKINKYRDYCNVFFFATPYPGAELYREMREKSRIPDEHEYLMKISGTGDAFNFAVNCTDAFTDEQLIETKKAIEKEVRADFYRKHPMLWLSRKIKWAFVRDIVIYVKLNGFKKTTGKIIQKLKTKFGKTA